MIRERLSQLGLELPAPPQALAAYVPARRVGTQIWVSGQLPFRNGALIARGPVPESCSPDIAREAARQCFLNALSAAAAVAKDLESIRGVLQITGYVQAKPEFTEHPGIINGASELALALFGERGQHVRAAVGVASLPLNASVEIAFVFEC